MTEKQTATIDLVALKAASLFVSAEEIRYYLCGVCVEIDATSARYVATDCHRLFAAERHINEKKQSANTLLGTFIIPFASCSPFKKDRAYDPFATLSEVDGLGMTMKFGDQVHVFKPIDGTFPDWRRILPQKEAAASVSVLSFNWDYVASFQKAGAILDAGSPYLISCGDGPALVRFPSDLTLTGLVMPKRAPNVGFWIPDWAKPADVAMEAA